MFNNGNLSNLMQQAQKMKENMKNIQKEIKSIEVVGESGAGLVKITLTGSHNCKKIEIDSTLFKDEDKEVIEDLTVAAFNDAVRKISEEHKKRMLKLSGKIPIPNDLKLPT
ncbi:MAG: YbaB/EbfC family nucleoid-associated protein [Buchnera aphidicola (Periphyllus lyropictus)]|uniref:YbaB/EbfC family nucleoid-associated protein n=1 Tax=Buchnera aphidicola TaxID=9 RepID=UPI001ECA7BC7|nr:YbaB/EbfC family nucleoid-associated protein [Buchnera aphidicola]NIH16509.1 YbaB/EbfC family nucleoid-associated protein [Buchnera aphidicola (Periphyllus lyropictus)]USS94794.1 YbaB/EbfC family nucleoid-associated protein [Buchnera aphidicola (Periphyllus lyropictus)]